MRQSKETTVNKRSAQGQELIRVGRNGSVTLPKDAVRRLKLKEGDMLECIYGASQIGLSPVREAQGEQLFSPSVLYLLLWKIPAHVRKTAYSD